MKAKLTSASRMSLACNVFACSAALFVEVAQPKHNAPAAAMIGRSVYVLILIVWVPMTKYIYLHI